MCALAGLPRVIGLFKAARQHNSLLRVLFFLCVTLHLRSGPSALPRLCVSSATDVVRRVNEENGDKEQAPSGAESSLGNGEGCNARVRCQRALGVAVVASSDTIQEVSLTPANIFEVSSVTNSPCNV